MDIKRLFQQNRIIAAVEQSNLTSAIQSEACAVLLMHAKITDLMEEEFQSLRTKKPILLHTDLVKGLSSDKEAFSLLSKFVKPKGIVTTKSAMIRAAKKEGLLTVQRIFLIDTSSFYTAIRNIKENEPDAIEIMPGIAPSIIKSFKEQIGQPIIAGGLITTAQHVDDAIQAGADAISLSKSELWNYDIRQDRQLNN